jgi:ubiquinone/menaquinone biosynthesis C-methylase UbiE
MLPRVLEPEVMDTAEEAADYDAMDHAEVNRRFVTDLLSTRERLRPGDWRRPGRVLDVGTGTALIPIELCATCPDIHVTAIDLAAEMLTLARRRVAAAALADRIDLQLVDAKHAGFPADAFDGVMSNSIVHHIPEPRTVLREMLRVLRPQGLLFVRDLLRPESTAEVERIVGLYAGSESPRQRQLFRQSLHAALTVAEMADLLAEQGLPRAAVQQTSDRHWTIAVLKPSL